MAIDGAERMSQFRLELRFTQQKHKSFRRGQAHMHALAEVDRHLYHEIVGTEFDPWHFDGVIPKFIARIESAWAMQ